MSDQKTVDRQNARGVVREGYSMIALEPVYTVQEIAKHFKRDDETIRIWIREGKFPRSYKDGAGGWLIKHGDVVAYEQEQNRKQIESGAISIESKKKSTRSSKGFVREW